MECLESEAREFIFTGAGTSGYDASKDTVQVPFTSSAAVSRTARFATAPDVGRGRNITNAEPDGLSLSESTVLLFESVQTGASEISPVSASQISGTRPVTGSDTCTARVSALSQATKNPSVPSA